MKNHNDNVYTNLLRIYFANLTTSEMLKMASIIKKAVDKYCDDSVEHSISNNFADVALIELVNDLQELAVEKA